jgi:hypothetical protein
MMAEGLERPNSWRPLESRYQMDPRQQRRGHRYGTITRGRGAENTTVQAFNDEQD